MFGFACCYDMGFEGGEKTGHQRGKRGEKMVSRFGRVRFGGLDFFRELSTSNPILPQISENFKEFKHIISPKKAALTQL